MGRLGRALAAGWQSVKAALQIRDPRLGKEAVERRVFEALAPLIGWQIEPDSLQQPRPPQPDILCGVVGIGLTAVELVALDATDTRRRLSHLFSTQHAWNAALEGLTADDRTALATDLRNAYISPDFANDAGSVQRARAFQTLQSFLLAHSQFDGDVSSEDLDLPQGFHGARIRRAEFDSGPHVSASSADYWRPPQLEKIVEKLCDKSYEPAQGARLELFAYATHDEPGGAVGSLEAIQALVAKHQSDSKFQRVHLFIWAS
jgi:hypothetical protein